MPRRKIPFSRAKIASLQFPRPKIRRILAETGGAHEGRAQCAKQAVVSPMSNGALQAAALQGDYCELWRVVVAGKLAPPPPACQKVFFDKLKEFLLGGRTKGFFDVRQQSQHGWRVRLVLFPHQHRARRQRRG